MIRQIRRQGDWTMQMRNWLPATALASGATAAVVRAYELESAFEHETGLAVSGKPVTILLAGFSVLIAVLFAAILLPGSHRGREKAYGKMLDGTYSGHLLWVTVSAAVLMLSAAYQAYSFFTGGTWHEMIFAMLTVFAAVSIGITARSVAANKKLEPNEFFVVVPVFWAIFWLIVEYIRIAADPVVPDYVFGILAVVCTLLGVNGLSSFQFGKVSPEIVVLFSLEAVYFSIISFLGPVLQNLFFPQDGVSTLTLILSNLNYAFSALFLYAVSRTVIDNIQIHYPNSRLKTE